MALTNARWWGGPWLGTLIAWISSTVLLALLPGAFTVSRMIRQGTIWIPGYKVISGFISKKVLELLAKVSGLAILQRHMVTSPRGKVVLITGASSGIGREIAIEYSRRQAKLVLAARTEEDLRHVVDDCAAYGAMDVAVFPCDVAKEDDCKNLVQFTIDRFSQLDILVNNAGTENSALFEDYESMADCRQTMGVNFWGNIHTTLYALQHLCTSRGQIVVTSSVVAYTPYPYLTFYSASKGAITSFYETLRIETCLKNGISITLALPGFVDSCMTSRQPSSYIPKWWPLVSPELVAMAIVEGAIQRQRYIVVPGWYLPSLFYRLLIPEVLVWMLQLFILGPAKDFNKRLETLMSVLRVSQRHK